MQLLIQTQGNRHRYNFLKNLYPSEGPLSRAKYPKHMAYFKAGKDWKERLVLAGNRVGKSLGIGGYEVTLHLTGQYPAWWPGRRFNHPVRAWACGDTGLTVRDINQEILLGPPGEFGTGLIPKDCIVGKPRPKAGGIPELVDSVKVKHISGGTSRLVFKTYKEGRESYQGTAQHIIWLDEEPPLDVYSESLMRTMTTNGMTLLTFTPLRGISDVVMMFLPTGDYKVIPGGGGIVNREDKRWVILATWGDAPHLTEAQKNEMFLKIPPYQRDARSKGIPQLGSGAIYPIHEEQIVVQPFELPSYWPRVYGMDVAWNRTAAVWGAIDREGDILYLYSEHYLAGAEPSVHAAAINSRGKWIPGVIDPASRSRSQTDGRALYNIYRKDLGLNIKIADNAVDAGIQSQWIRMSTGRLKVFENLQHWLAEFRIYRRDEKGNIVKKDDHLQDSTRYLILSGLSQARTRATAGYVRSAIHHRTASESVGY